MPTPRMRRVNEAVREVVSAHIPEDLKDTRIGFITVTAVDTSPDLRRARVYVSVLGSAAEQQGTLDGLTSAHGYLQGKVGRQLSMKRTPQLTFHLDETAARADRLERLLEQVAPAPAPEEDDA